ncbi:hypothetical protein AAG570_001680, partial [Ranatra chinensis]
QDEVTKELDALLSRKCQLEAKIRNIAKVLPNIEIIHSDSKQLAEMISFTSILAENVSAKVRKLDTARSRVSECQQRVHDLLDLQLCCGGVQSSLRAEDFEKAAAHVHRYLNMDQHLLEKTADDMHQDCTSVSNSLSLLKEAAGRLRDIITKKFNEAVHSDDTPSVERFFKLFPLIGMHDFGLDSFSTFLAKKVEASSKKNLRLALETSVSDKRSGVIFSDTMTQLFEDIARVLEVHQPIVETYYGPGRLLRLVVQLQEECDRRVKVVLGEMWRRRNLDRLSAAIKSSLSQPGLDPKDLDQLLIEITAIHSRYNLYRRFIRKKVYVITDDTKRDSCLAELESLLKSCELCRRMEDLIGEYLLLEHYYMEESVRKAIVMDTVQSGSPLVSSMVDDVFFIVRKCIRRANSTGSIDGVCAVINNSCGVLETQLCSALNQSMRHGFPTGYLDLTQAYNVMIQGRLHTASSDTESAKNTFIAHLNDTEVGSEYVGTLVTGLAEEVLCSSEVERCKLESCLSGLGGVSAAMAAAQELGLHQLRNSAVKPRIAPWVDSFLTLSHFLTEEEFSSYEANEPFIRSLIGNLDTLLSEFKSTLMPINYDNLVAIVATEVSSQMEKVILKTEFNRLGGLVLDKEVRSLTSYLSNATSWSVRDKFARLTQIATVLNLERVAEIADYWGTSPRPWRLTPQDVKKVLKLR